MMEADFPLRQSRQFATYGNGATANCTENGTCLTYTLAYTLPHRSEHISLIINNIDADARDLKDLPYEVPAGWGA
jgi:hypothetical protein